MFLLVPRSFSALGLLGAVFIFFLSTVFFLLTGSQIDFYNYTAPTVLNPLKRIFCHTLSRSARSLPLKVFRKVKLKQVRK